MYVLRLFRGNIQYFILGLGVFLLMYPSFTWGIINQTTYVGFSLLIIALVIEVLRYRALIIAPPLPVYLFLLYIIYMNLVGVSTGGRIFDTRLIVSLILFLFSKHTLYRAYINFVYIFGILIIFSLLFYGFYIFGVYNLDFVKVIGTDGREYYNYPFNTMLSYMKRPGGFPISFYRFSAFVGEPGWIGGRAVLILASLKFQFKRYKILYAFLLAAILSFSLAAYVPLFISVFYFLINRKIKINFKGIAIGALILVLISSLNLGLFEKYIASRLVIQDGALAGDNRTGHSFNEEWKTFIYTPEVIFGKGKGQSNKFEGTAGWKTLVYNSGYIGFVLYISIFVAVFLFLWRKGNRSYAFFFLFLFLLTLYHRTRLHQIYYLLILYGGLLYNEKDSVRTLKNKNEK